MKGDSGILLGMKVAREQLIELIHASGYKACLVVTGGGSGALHALLAHPGASRFVLEAQVPYSPESMSDYLGECPGRFCSPETATAMAQRAFERASDFFPSGAEGMPVLGISCTAALQTIRTRKGADRAFICIKSGEQQEVREIELEQGSRGEQEDELSTQFLAFIAGFVGREE
jgi:nicotinamide mononucleotide (NMN) deamidase PncC